MTIQNIYLANESSNPLSFAYPQNASLVDIPNVDSRVVNYTTGDINIVYNNEKYTFLGSGIATLNFPISSLPVTFLNKIDLTTSSAYLSSTLEVPLKDTAIPNSLLVSIDDKIILFYGTSVNTYQQLNFDTFFTPTKSPTVTATVQVNSHWFMIFIIILVVVIIAIIGFVIYRKKKSKQ